MNGRCQLFLLGAIALAGACDKSDELRSTLETRRSAWVQRVSALQSRASNLEQRLKAQPPPAGNAPVAEQAQRRRLEAAVAGSRQTLFDMQTHITESVRDVETAIGQDRVQGEEALTGVASRMNEYVQQQEQALAANEEALTRTGKDIGQ